MGLILFMVLIIVAPLWIWYSIFYKQKNCYKCNNYKIVVCNAFNPDYSNLEVTLIVAV